MTYAVRVVEFDLQTAGSHYYRAPEEQCFTLRRSQVKKASPRPGQAFVGCWNSCDGAFSTGSSGNRGVFVAFTESELVSSLELQTGLEPCLLSAKLTSGYTVRLPACTQVSGCGRHFS